MSGDENGTIRWGRGDRIEGDNTGRDTVEGHLTDDM